MNDFGYGGINHRRELPDGPGDGFRRFLDVDIAEQTVELLIRRSKVDQVQFLRGLTQLAVLRVGDFMIPA